MRFELDSVRFVIEKGDSDYPHSEKIRGELARAEEKRVRLVLRVSALAENGFSRWVFWSESVSLKTRLFRLRPAPLSSGATTFMNSDSKPV
jgi:hypothetical protein